MLKEYLIKYNVNRGTTFGIAVVVANSVSNAEDILQAQGAYSGSGYTYYITNTTLINDTDKYNAPSILEELATVSGESAYEIAARYGYTGTEQEWLLSIKGEKGDKGDKGNKGDKGDTGRAFTYNDFTESQLADLKGPKGDIGDRGPRGYTGERGPQGLQGIKGEQGPQGEQGIQGIKGDKGDKGDKGEQGARGDIGPQGAPGAKGDPGERGPQGERGPRGLTGEKGERGLRGYSGAVVGIVEEITYAELRELKNSNNLVTGRKYRITDFVTSTFQTNTRSAGHPFDIIVTALDNHTLSEIAQAIQHEGDTYFANKNLSAWQVWYNFDNNTTLYKWAKKWVDETPQKWTTQWGVLEEKCNAENSTNYTTVTVDGVTKYLYKPTYPTNYLKDKVFYYYKSNSSITVTDMNEVYIVSAENPDDTYWEDITLLCIYKDTNTLLASWPATQEWGNDEGYYNIGFGYEESEGGEGEEEEGSSYKYDMKHTPGDTIDIKGVTYYRWEDYNGGYSNMEYDIVDHTFGEMEKVYFTGSVDSLYYAFDSVLSKTNKGVMEVYSKDTGKIYFYNDGQLDLVTYTAYKEPVIGSKGVIYRLIDEFNNDVPFDFKNIQFNNGGSWYYTFGTSDQSLSGTSYANIIKVTNNKNMPIIIFKGVSSDNTFSFSLSGTAIFGGVCQGNTIECTTTFSNISVTDALYGNLITCRTNGSLTISGRMTACFLRGLSDATFTGRFFNSEFANKISVHVTDSKKNAKLIRNLRAIGGNEVASVVRIISDLTESSNYTNIANVELMAINWGQTEVSVPIDSYFSNTANNIPAMLKISKNSNGVVKCWRDADLIQ